MDPCRPPCYSCPTFPLPTAAEGRLDGMAEGGPTLQTIAATISARRRIFLPPWETESSFVVGEGLEEAQLLRVKCSFTGKRRFQKR